MLTIMILDDLYRCLRWQSGYSYRRTAQMREYDFSPAILQEPAYYQPDEKPGPKKVKQASKLLLKLTKRVKC